MSLIIIAIAIGLAYAGLLYGLNRKLHYGKSLTAVLFALRSIVVAVVMMLLLNPYIKQKINKIDQPIIVFAEDNSLSITMTDDSVFYKNMFPQVIDSLANILENDYDIERYSFGGNYTDISSALSAIHKLYYKKNVGAVVLFSDGIVNQGVEPEFYIENFPFPIYSVALGDTASHPDLFIQDVRCNKSVPSSMAFPLRFNVNANNAKNLTMNVSVKIDGSEVENVGVEITSKRFSKTLDFNIMPDGDGIKQIDIQIDGLENETQLLNNKRRLFIEVIDRRYKVLCYAKAPHPDISAIRSALGDHYEFETVFANGPEGSKTLSGSDFNLLVVHQMPIPENVNGIDTRTLPVLAVIGASTSPEDFNESQGSLIINKGAVNSNLDIKARYNNNFGLFTVSSEIKNEISNYPPLSLPHLNFTFKSSHEDLLLMNIIDLHTSDPMLTFTSDAGGRKFAFLFGTGCWRWRLYEYYQHRNHDGFDEIFGKTVKYLLTERDKELIINHKESYITTESISFTAELKNPSRELVTEPELRITFGNRRNKKTYDYVFAKGENNYHLNVGMLPEGVYDYAASARLGDIDCSANGNFVVETLGVEAQDLTAKTERMRQLAEQTNGKYYYINDIQELTEDITNDSRITSILREEKRYDSLINFKWLFFSILGLITIEWVLRKMFGGY